MTKDEIFDAQKAWAKGIVAIGRVFSAKGDYKTRAIEHIDTLYGYDEGPVLFKPTLASKQQFRSSKEEALSYFVGGSIAEDMGFAIRPWIDVRFDNHGIILRQNSAFAMGNYFITQSDGEVLKVEYSFCYFRAENGSIKINLHHSSLPFSG